MTNNDLLGGFIAGIGISAIIVAIFQIGINVGVKTSIQIIDEYGAAKNFLTKHKKVAQILPYVIGGQNNE